MILTLDPGKRLCGCSLFHPGSRDLYAASLVQGPTTFEGPEQWGRMALAVQEWADYKLGEFRVSQVVFERMGARGTDTPSKTLIIQELLAVGVWVCALFPEAEHTALFPHEWEGALKRTGETDPIVDRVKSRLSKRELGRVELPSAKSLQHNVWDSVGIGLKFLGRFEPRKVISRT